MAVNTLGRYQIIREIARSNDIVYEARDPVMGRRIAIKELSIPPSLVGQARRERIDRFFREAKAAGGLSPHPHIVTIYDYGQQGERYFIAMEYLEGQALREILQMNGPLPVERAVRLAAQVCEALAYAHQRGVIHRDIKPDNIHVLPGDVAKLTDFGIARITADPTITADGQVFGTPSYMSPEQVAGKQLDARTDVYSLGVTLYEMLVGRKPFTGDTVVTITYNIMNQELPAMAGVPAHVQQVVARAMSKAPEARFRSAEEMRDALLNPRPAATMAAAAAPAYRAPTMMPGAGAMPPPAFSPAAPARRSHSGPEPTAQDPPPIYVPRRPSALAQGIRKHGHFLSMLGLAILLALACVFFAWVANAAYQNWKNGARETEAQKYLQQGVDLFYGKQYAEAIVQFKKAADAAPNTGTARLAEQDITAAYTEQGNQALGGRPAEAAQAYESAIQYSPGSIKAHLGLGYAYQKLGRNGDAAAAWQWVLENAPADPDAAQARQALAQMYFSDALAAYNTRQYDQAISLWGKCLSVADPSSDIARQASQWRERALAEGMGMGTGGPQ